MPFLFTRPTVSVGGNDVTLVRGQLVDSTALLALDTTPIAMVPGAGVDTVNLPQALSVYYQAGSTAYTPGATPLYLWLGFMPDPVATGIIRLNVTDLNGLTDKFISLDLVDIDNDAADALNAPLGIKLADPVTLGDGTIFVTVHYVLV